MRPMPVLQPVLRRSLSDAVFEQIRGQILRGERRPGSALPAERALCEALGVNRSAVREALRRLEQAGLVFVRQGDSSRVRDFRASASLDLLPSLLVKPDGRFDPDVVRSILEMRGALGPDAARLAATRGGAACAQRLDAVVDAMRGADVDLEGMQEHATAYWGHLVDGAGNVAYRLAFNALHATYDQVRALLARAMEAEIGDPAPYAAIADAIRNADATAAEARARTLLARGAQGILAAMARVDSTAGGSR